jgi:hypothetical protein
MKEPHSPEPQTPWENDDRAAAFVAGARWWEYHQTGATMWQYDQSLAWKVARDRYPVNVPATTMNWLEIIDQRDNHGNLTALALAVDALVNEGCDCGPDESGTCVFCRCEAALKALWERLEKAETERDGYADEITQIVALIPWFDQMLPSQAVAIMFDDIRKHRDEALARAEKAEAERDDALSKLRDLSKTIVVLEVDR